MAHIETNADEAAAGVARKAAAISSAVGQGMRSALIATETEAVKNLSGSNSDAPYAYPVPVRSGNLRRNRTVQQPSPGLGLINFNSDYAFAVHSGIVMQFAGRGKSKKVQRPARPFAQDAVDKVDPEHFVLDAVAQAVAA